MKKILSIALAVVMVLSIASVAAAFNWGPAASSGDSFGYGIDVIKFTRSTGEIGSSYFNADDAATAVNGADVYFAIKLTVPDLSATNGIRANAEVEIDATAISGFDGGTYDISGLSKGTYYYMEDAPGLADGFYLIDAFVANARWMNFVSETPVFARYCLDTDTAEVYAEVTSDRPLGRWFTVGGYDIGKVALGAADAIPANVAIQGADVDMEEEGNLDAATEITFTFPSIRNYQASACDVNYNMFGFTGTVTVAAGATMTGAAVATAVAGDLDIRQAGNTVFTIDGVNFQAQQGTDRRGNPSNEITFTEQVAPSYTTEYRGNPPAFTFTAAGTAAVPGTEVIEFREASTPVGNGDVVAVIPLDGNDKALDVLASAQELAAYNNRALAGFYTNLTWAGTQAVTDLMAWLDEGNSKTFRDAVAAGEVYMTDSNLRTAFGFAYKVSDSITWKANSTPIILDPTVGIPKTGDNASVIGFAMIMVAVVAAAVAVRKVNA